MLRDTWHTGRLSRISTKGRIASVAVVFGLVAAAVIASSGYWRSAPEGQGYYVSPAGRPDGTGSFDAPWNLETALSHPARVQPGDTIWLRGGNYQGTFTSNLKGQMDRPIKVRQYPGERATIDGGGIAVGSALTVRGSDAWYWGFEIMSSNPKRVSLIKGSDPDDLPRVGGVNVFGPRTRFINLIIHDTAGGYGFWTPAEDAEIYGNLLYYNGWSAPDRGHGHGVYAQNLNGRKRLEDNIQFSGFGMGFHVYGSNRAFVRNFDFIGNVAVNSGALTGDPPAHWANFFLAGGTSAEGIVFDSNHSYHSPAVDRGSSSLGWVFSEIEKDLVARKNYWIGGAPAIELWNWNELTFEENVSYSAGDLMLNLNQKQTQDRSQYRVDRNTYYGSGLLRLSGRNHRWSQWREAAKLDSNSQYHEGRPNGTWVFLRPNRYEEGRGHLVIYNWDLKESVPVNFESVLPKGTAFELRDAENYFGPPVLKAVYTGSPVDVPMRGLTAATPVGVLTPAHTAPEFGVFVVIKTPQ